MNNPELTSQLTFYGLGSKADERSLAVLDHLAQGIYSPLAIAYAMQITVAQVAKSIEWLGRQGYAVLDMNGQLMRLTPSGWAVAKKRNGGSNEQ